MSTIDDISRAIARGLSPEFEQRLRAELADKDRAWLVDELVRVTLARYRLEDLEAGPARQPSPSAAGSTRGRDPVRGNRPPPDMRNGPITSPSDKTTVYRTSAGALAAPMGAIEGSHPR